MQAFIDPTLCIGCTQCASICPEVFHMEEHLAYPLEGEIPDAYDAQTAQAEQSCPVGAISLQN